MDSSIENLVFVTRLSARKIQELSVQLEQAPERLIGSILNSIDKESIILSTSVGKLSAHIDEIRGAENIALEDTLVVVDDNLLRIVAALRAHEQPVCDRCGGLRSN